MNSQSRVQPSPDSPAAGSAVPQVTSSRPIFNAYERLERRVRAISNSLLLLLGGALLAGFLIVPMLVLFARGFVFGADWSEYLYSGPSLIAGTRPLFQYPYPVLPIAYLPLESALGHSSLTSVYLVEVVSGLLVVATFYAGYLACRQYTGSVRGGWVGGLFFSGFPLLQSEIGWGGQAQLLAYFLGLIALWATFKHVLPGLKVRPALGVGFLLGIAALTELYAAATVALIFLLFLIPVLGRRLFSGSGAAVFLATLGPPSIVGAALVWALPAAANPAGGVRLLALLKYPSVYQTLWIDLTFGTWALAVVYVGAFVLYVGFRLLFSAPSPSRVWLVPATVASALAMGALLTPAVISYRVVYPLAFPLAFATSELAAPWGASERIGKPRPRWHLLENRTSRAFPMFAVSVLVLAGTQLGADLQLYPNSLDTYAFSQGEISELFFLAHEPGAVLYDVAPVDHMFVDLWATGRPIYPGPAFEPYTVTSAPKQAAVELATALSYGENWIDDGRFVVTEAESAWGQPDPGILFFQNAHTFLSIEGNDFRNNLGFSPDSDPSLRESTDLFNTSSTSTVAGGQGLTTTYLFAGYSVDRVVTVASSGTIYWNYSYSFPGAIPRSATLYVTESGTVATAGSVSEESACCSEATVVQQFPEPPLPEVDQSYSINSTATNATVSAHYLPKDQYGAFELEYDIVPSNSTVRTFSVDIAIDPQGSSRVVPSVHTEVGELAATGIEWVVLSRSSNQLILQRFMGDPKFPLYRATPHFFILSAG